MMIKITEKCSMGCTHCMNDAKSSGKHMDFDTFKKVIAFQKKYGGPFCFITGGEPTEHPQFKKFFTYAMEQLPECFMTIATNGVWMQDNYQFVADVYDCHDDLVQFQVCNAPEYYPTLIDRTLPVFNLPNVLFIDKIQHIYPQGRAVTNNLEWEAKGTKCFNVRSFLQQMGYKNLKLLISMLAVHGRFCTPHITIDGHIKVGESDLCPNCSHIDKSEAEIVNDILNFRCRGCAHVLNNMDQQLKDMIGE